MRTEEIEEYIKAHSDPEPELLQQLTRDAHVKLLHPRMISGHTQGRLLKMFVRMMQPRRILEIGTFVGYSALCMAEALPPDGIIDTIDIDDELETFARRYLDRSPHRSKIRYHLGDALQLIPAMTTTFDLVFIDGDKRQYTDYYEAVLPRVRQGGVILADNTLWNGKVIDSPALNDRQTHGILTFNTHITSDSRVEKVILPLRDGLTIVYKK